MAETAARLKDLTGIEGMSADDILGFLRDAQDFKREHGEGRRSWDVLKGKAVALLFYEPSTRTRFSFELAAKRLGAETLAFSAAASSAAKGETLSDTIKNLEAMGVDAFILRHPDSGAAKAAAAAAKGSVINAGDGTREHPTQALLDFMTLQERKGGFKGLKVVYVGDILHSRVARSGAFGLKTLGAKVTFCGPPTLVPESARALGATVQHDLKLALKGADAVIALRLQLERQKENLFPSLAEYAKLYCLTPETISWAKPDCLVMHPGPLNRGVEISDEVADNRSVVLEQVANGVFLRMAVLRKLLSFDGDVS